VWKGRWLAAPAAAVAAAAAIVLGSGGDTARDIGARLGLLDDPPFAIRLSGPLWRDRILHDSEGAPDVALVTRNEPLVAAVVAPGRSQIAEVELRVDGRLQRRVKLDCPGGRCPDTLSVSFLPRLDPQAGGRRHVEVVARDRAGVKPGADTGAHVSVAGLTLRVVARLPAVIEAEPATLPVGAPPGAALAAPERRAALQLLARARRAGPLRALLGAAALRVRAAGTLRNGTAVVGATLFLQLTVPRRNVSATVPGYVPGESRAGPYVPRAVDLGVAALRDLLVDVDLGRRRVISVEPGPASVTTSWSNIDPSAHEGLGSDVDAVVDAAARLPRLVKASDRGPAVLAYDGNLSLNPYERDWPVSLLFTGHATIDKVKDALRSVGFTHRGNTHYLAYRLPGQGLRFDSDRGLKTNCDAAATDVHLRMYAPAEVDHFQDPQFGSMVAATAHLDHADGCGTGTPRYGFSGIAERRVAAAARRLGWRVQRDALLMGNTEPYRRDVRDPSHIWLGNGRATVIWVP
jgi:hypothetical protein